jgi:hypothetical protein
MVRCWRVAFAVLFIIALPADAQNQSGEQSPNSEVRSISRPAPANPDGDTTGQEVAPSTSLSAEPGVWELWINPARDDRVWFRADYLLFKVRESKIPGVAGELSAQKVDPMQRLDDNLIHPVVGGSASGVDYPMQSGYRVEAGFWLERGGSLAIEAGFFQLEPGRRRINLQSSDAAALGPIFFDPSAGQEVIIMDSVPGLRTSEWSSTASDRLWGAQIQGRLRTGFGIDVLAGYRHLQFNEDLYFAGSSTAIPGGRLPCG